MTADVAAREYCSSHASIHSARRRMDRLPPIRTWRNSPRSHAVYTVSLDTPACSAPSPTVNQTFVSMVHVSWSNTMFTGSFVFAIPAAAPGHLASAAQG
jgi:hypothetical protein